VNNKLERKAQIAPSILSADFAHLAREIDKVEKAGADVLHLDVMDGHFVPNITIGAPVISAVRKITSLPLDVHLMIQQPSLHIRDMVKAGANWISVHVEAEVHLDRTIHFIQEQGALAGVAINPATPIAALEEILPEVDFVLVMSVNPGFAGQKFIPATLQKIRRLREVIRSGGYRAQIEVDGGIGPDNLGEVISAGAKVVVAGSAIFAAKTMDSSEAIRAMKNLAAQQTAFSKTT
jgi:ribulose-phosphate 3-epimerase